MSQMFSVHRAVIAATLTVAAAPFAMGGELPAWLVRSPAVAAAAPASAGNLVNDVVRDGKSDRAPVLRAGVESRTFSIQPSGLDDTSVLVRIVSRKPDRRIDGNTPATSLQPRSTASGPRAACEPVVSMLTEVARQLAPGRCVT